MRRTIRRLPRMQKKTDSLEADHTELMELAGPDVCKCGIPQGPGHEVIGGRIFTETHPLGPLINHRVISAR